MRTIVILSCLFSIVWALGAFSFATKPDHNFLFEIHADIQFPSSSACKDCHGKDPDGISSTTSSGEDVNVYDDWKYSMKALAGKDPFWKAQMEYEQMIGSSESISDCFQCHIPAAYQRSLINDESISLESLDSFHMVDEGVNCSSCHQIQEFEAYNGLHTYSDSGLIKGPYPNPFSGPMEDLFGWPVEYDPIMRDSEACMSCHTIIHQRDDKIVPEQATYLEWKYSEFNSLQKECQQCHMPYLLEPIKLASEYPFLEGRVPFAQHSFLGSNSFMIKAILNQLGQTDSTSHIPSWNEIITEKEDFLRSAATLRLESTIPHEDSLDFVFTIQNETGHKLPTGYPSRKLFLQFTVLKDGQDTLFKTPAPYQYNWSIQREHIDLVNDAEDVQLYEYIAVNSNGQLDYSLHQAASVQKDNRLLPKGFIENDTIAVIGKASQDINFDALNGQDQISLRVPILNTKQYTLNAQLWYVLVSPEWLQKLNTTQANIAQNLSTYFDQEPPYQLIDSITIHHQLVQTAASKKDPITVYPNPAQARQVVRIKGLSSFPAKMLIITPNGSVHHLNLTDSILPISYLQSSGVYYIFIGDQRIALVIQ